MNLDKIFDLFFSKSPKPVFSDKKILVIDDGEVERQFLSRTLDKGGYRVKTAESGELGLKAVQEEVPDLILLDFVMPGINGDEVCKKLKMDERTKKVPVVFLTGSVKPSSVISSFDSGAEYYLSKPIGAQELLKQVDMILSEKGAESDPSQPSK